MSGMLYLVPTPIGNLGDISARCRETLAAVDFIAAEDTRVCLRLLNYLQIKKPLVSYYEHNRAQSGQRIVSRILEGETCALVTDAGTPAISDPGEDLVALCAASGIPVTALPGPCAAITALAVSGLPTGRFTFEGFLSTTRKNRQAHLESLRAETRTMIFYEAPHKLKNTLKDLEQSFGPERRIVLCREMTKLHEEILRTTLAGASAFYADQTPRGEYVLIVEGAGPAEEPAAGVEDGVELVRRMRTDGLSLKDAVRQAAAQTGLPRNALYEACVRQAAEDGSRGSDGSGSL